MPCYFITLYFVSLLHFRHEIDRYVTSYQLNNVEIFLSRDNTINGNVNSIKFIIYDVFIYHLLVPSFNVKNKNKK